MTRLYANLRRHHHHQVISNDRRRALEAESSMSSLSDISDELLPPPGDDVDAQLISRVYGIGRKPTTIALTFRPPRKHRFTDKLPKLVSKTTKPRNRRPNNVTSPPAGDAASLSGRNNSDDGHVTSGRQNNGTMASKSMHSLTKMNAAGANRRATLPAGGGNGIKTITTLLDRRHHVVTSSPEVEEHRISDRLLSAERKPTHPVNTIVTRSTSCPMPQLMVTPAAAADNTDAKHLVHSSRPPCSNLDRRSSTPAVSPLSLRPPAAIGRLAPGVSDLPSKPRLDSLFNTHGDIAKFRQLLRESTDETMSEERVNYCCDVTTTRIEAWLRSVRAARLTAGGLCRQTADASLESERAIKLLQNNDKKSDMNPTTDY